MSRKLACLLLAVSLVFSSFIVANADDQKSSPPSEIQDPYAAAAAEIANTGASSASDTLSNGKALSLAIDLGMLSGDEGSVDLSQMAAKAMVLKEEQARAAAEAAAEAEAKAAAQAELLSTYDGVMFSCGGLNIRSGAGEEFSVVRTAPNGKVARLLSVCGDWYEISFGSASGFVSADGCQAVHYADYAGTAATSTLREDVVAYAETYLGTPYVYGGISRSGVDCSGFTMQVFAQFGISLIHGASDQYAQCTPISDSERQAGDLVFFSTYTSGISHVGIYIGGGCFIHASSSYGVTISSLNESYYAGAYLFSGRLINE